MKLTDIMDKHLGIDPDDTIKITCLDDYYKYMAKHRGETPIIKEPVITLEEPKKMKAKPKANTQKPAAKPLDQLIAELHAEEAKLLAKESFRFKKPATQVADLENQYSIVTCH